MGFTERLWEGQGARGRWAGAAGCGLMHGWAGSQELVVKVVLRSGLVNKPRDVEYQR